MTQKHDEKCDLRECVDCECCICEVGFYSCEYYALEYDSDDVLCLNCGSDDILIKER